MSLRVCVGERYVAVEIHSSTLLLDRGDLEPLALALSAAIEESAYWEQRWTEERL